MACPSKKTTLSSPFKENNIVEPNMVPHPDGSDKKTLSANYNLARITLSLACTDKFIVRMVHKVLQKPDGSDKRDCAQHKLMSGTFEGSASPLVRCKLELPAGPGSEDARAVRAKEKRCYICGYCSRGSGCPATVSSWVFPFFLLVITRGVHTPSGHTHSSRSCRGPKLKVKPHTGKGRHTALFTRRCPAPGPNSHGI